MERDMSSGGTTGRTPITATMEPKRPLFEEPVIECFTITDLISILARRARSSADNAAVARSFTTMRQQELVPQRIRALVILKSFARLYARLPGVSHKVQIPGT